jgi:hypothetical protein
MYERWKKKKEKEESENRKIKKNRRTFALTSEFKFASTFTFLHGNATA